MCRSQFERFGIKPRELPVDQIFDIVIRYRDVIHVDIIMGEDKRPNLVKIKSRVLRDALPNLMARSSLSMNHTVDSECDWNGARGVLGSQRRFLRNMLHIASHHVDRELKPT